MSLVLAADVVELQRRGLVPPHAAQLSFDCRWCARDYIAEVEFTPLTSHIVVFPVIIHDEGKDRGSSLPELLQPLAAIHIAKRYERNIEGHDRCGHAVRLNGDPMLHRKPFMTCARIHILGGVHRSCLKFKLKLRMVDRKWKSEIDGLFIKYLVLLDVFDKLDLLFVLE